MNPCEHSPVKTKKSLAESAHLKLPCKTWKMSQGIKNFIKQ